MYEQKITTLQKEIVVQEAEKDKAEYNRNVLSQHEQQMKQVLSAFELKYEDLKRMKEDIENQYKDKKSKWKDQKIKLQSNLQSKSQEIDTVRNESRDLLKDLNLSESKLNELNISFKRSQDQVFILIITLNI